jgi:hypothetical protein
MNLRFYTPHQSFQHGRRAPLRVGRARVPLKGCGCHDPTGMIVSSPEVLYEHALVGGGDVKRRMILVGLVGGLFVAGCGEPTATAPELDAGVVRLTTQSRLVQEVRIEPAEPRVGDTVVIRSTVTNRGAARVETESRICGLDIQTELAYADPFARCAGYSQTVELGVGRSVMASDQFVVTGAPGSYPLRVRHLLSPEQWVSIQLRVRP